MLRRFNLVKPSKTELERWIKKHSREYSIIWALDIVTLPSVIKGSKTYGIPVIYETLDLVAEYPYEKKIQNIRKKYEKKYIKKAAKVITAGDEYADYYVREYHRFGLKERPIVVHNSQPVISEKPNDIVGDLKFLFFGNITYDRPIDELLEAFSIIKRGAKLTIMGKNFLGNQPNERLSELGLEDRVEIVPPVPPSEAVKAAMQYDVGIAMLENSNINEYYAPTAKLGTYMSAGLAIIATKLPGMIVELEGVKAVFAEPSNMESWESAFAHVVNAPRDEIMQMKDSSFARGKLLNSQIELSKRVKVFSEVFNSLRND